LGCVVPGSAEGADETFECNWVPFSSTGLTVVAGIEIWLISRTSALGGLLVESKVVRTSDALFVSEVPSCRFWTGDALSSSVHKVLPCAIAFLCSGVPGLVGLASFALEVGIVPLSVTGLANVVSVEVGLFFGADALRDILVEGEAIGASHTLLVLDVPSGRSWAIGAFSCPIIIEISLAFALLGFGVEGLVIFAGDTFVCTVRVWLISRAYAV